MNPAELVGDPSDDLAWAPGDVCEARGVVVEPDAAGGAADDCVRKARADQVNACADLPTAYADLLEADADGLKAYADVAHPDGNRNESDGSLVDRSAGVDDAVAGLAEADHDVADPVGDGAASLDHRTVADGLVGRPHRSLRRPNKLVALADGGHAVPVEGLCGSDTGLPDAGNFAADAAGDVADLSSQPVSLWVSVPIRRPQKQTIFAQWR